MRRRFATMLLLLAALAGCRKRGDAPDAGADARGGTGKSTKTDRGAKGSRPGSGQSLPVTAVTLFASGAAYVEHAGLVKGDAAVELRCPAATLPGLLKTLTVDDGTSGAPAYTIEPVVPAAATQPTTRPEKEGGDEGRASVFVHLRGGKTERGVRVGYVVECQAWKPAYRLLLGDRPASLQAWASVTNDTNDDWKNVVLTLASEAPIVVPADANFGSESINQAARRSGVPLGDSLRRPKPIPSRSALDALPTPDAEAPPAIGPGTPPDAATATRPANSASLAATRPSAPATLDPREIFRHAVGEVSIPKRGTLILPLLGAGVTAERVAVFNEGLLRRNPLRAARLENTTRRFLPPGPVTVLDAGQYAGDAALDALAPGRRALVSWGIEVSLVVDASEDVYATAAAGARIEKGALHLGRRHAYTRTYRAENDAPFDQVLVIEHPIRKGWLLAEPTRPFDATEALYRFRTTVPAGQTTTFAVTEYTTDSEALELAAADVPTLVGFTHDKDLPQGVRDALGKLVPGREQVIRREQSALEAQARFDRLTSERERVRGDLRDLSEFDTARAKLQERAADLDRQLTELRGQLAQADEAAGKAREDLARQLRDLSVGQ